MARDSRPANALMVRPPAKLNLGLEILGKRPDGYHEIRSVMQTISLRDEMGLRLSEARVGDLATIRDVRAADPRLDLDGHGLSDDSNLVVRALRLLAEREPHRELPPIEIQLLKRIPPASGMGGASSDAAAALIAGSRLWRMDLPPAALHGLASKLGADVPFFLRGGTASVSGIGERLEPLPDLGKVWFVVAFPLRMNVIPRKTVTLYRALSPPDWTDGQRVNALSERVRSRQLFDGELLANAFERPLYELRPELRDLREAMRRAGASVVALSGAGPTHYAVEFDPERAEAVAASLGAALGHEALVNVVEPVPAGINIATDVD